MGFKPFLFMASMFGLTIESNNQMIYVIQNHRNSWFLRAAVNHSRDVFQQKRAIANNPGDIGRCSKRSLPHSTPVRVPRHERLDLANNWAVNRSIILKVRPRISGYRLVNMLKFTPRTVNMEHENTPLEKENHLNQTIIFRFQLLIFQGVTGMVNKMHRALESVSPKLESFDR